MRCKKHTADLSSTVGVCASCLRERLISVVASAAAYDYADYRYVRGSDPPPLVYPRSVSPYVAPRKSEARESWSSHRRFFSTPQVDPGTSYGVGSGDESDRSLKKKGSGFSRFSKLFSTRSDECESGYKFSVSDPRLSSRHSCDTSTTSPSSSRSWLPRVFSTRSKQKPTPCYIEDMIASTDRRPRRVYCRGMSPAIDGEEENEREPSASVQESPGMLERTPTTASTGTPSRQKTRKGLGKNVSGMTFCLSPLVRASPGRHWRRKGNTQPEFGYSGDSTAPEKPHISTASSYCANRSKKLVDLGRANRDRR